MVDVHHRVRDGRVASDVRDRPVHRLHDAAVLRMPLGRGAQLEHLHRRARVDLHRVPDSERERHDVLRLLRMVTHEVTVQRLGPPDGLVPAVGDPGLGELRRGVVAVLGGEPLPLDGAHAVPL